MTDSPSPSPPRAPRFLAKLGVSVGTLVVLALLGEVAGRLAGFGATPQFLEVHSHEHLQMVPRPNQEQLVGVDDPATGERRVPMRINAWGQRGADYPLEKPAGEYRIIGLGDSLTFGRGVGTEETYLALLGQAWRDAPPSLPADRRVRVVNASFNGYATFHYVQWVRTQLERFQPDLLLVGLYSGNDMEPVGAYGHGALFDLSRKSALRRMCIAGYNRFLWKRVRAWKEGKSVAEVEQDLDRYRGTESVSGHREVVMQQWSTSMEHLLEIHALAQARGIPAVCVLIPTSWMTESVEEPMFYAWLRGEVEQTGLPVIDLYPALHAMHQRHGAAALEGGEGDESTEPSAPWLGFDAGHMNVDGHRAAARVVRAGLADLGLVE